MRTIAPSGFLHTFEFNEFRATRAQEEFEENALGEFWRLFHTWAHTELHSTLDVFEPSR